MTTIKTNKDERVQFAKDALELLVEAEEMMNLVGDDYLQRLMVKLVNARGTQREDGIYQLIQSWIEKQEGGDNK